jgi:hypothetical protein
MEENKLFVLASTGQNFANLPPLMQLYNAGDEVLTLESSWSKKSGQTAALEFFFKNHLITNQTVTVADSLPEMMDEVYALCKPYLKYKLVIIANGNTKLFTLALYEALMTFQPALAYGERQAFMHYYAKGLRAGGEKVVYSHELDLPDILAMQSQIIEGKGAQRIWHYTQRNLQNIETSLEEYGRDPQQTITHHDIKYYAEKLKEKLPSNDYLAFIKNYLPARWESLLEKSFHLTETLSQYFEQPVLQERFRPKAKMKLEEQLMGLHENFELVLLYNVLDKKYQIHCDNQSTEKNVSAQEWLKTALLEPEILDAFSRYIIAIYSAYTNRNKDKFTCLKNDIPPFILSANNSLGQENKKTSDLASSCQQYMLGLGCSLLKLARERDKLLFPLMNTQAYKESIGPIFEKYVAQRVLKWLETSETAKQVLQSVWTNVSIKRKNESTVHSELDVALVLKNGIIIHLECKSAGAKKKDVDARIANLAKTSVLSRQYVCAPLYIDFLGHSAYQKIMKEFALNCQRVGIDYIPVDLPTQQYYADTEGANKKHITVNKFTTYLDKLLEAYQIT